MRRRATTLLLAAAVLATSACSTDGKGKATTADGPTGGTLRIGITEPGSVDPGNAYEPAGMLIDSLVCEPLLQVDPDTGELKAGLVSTWIVSDSGRRITLRLRKAAKFSDGSSVTSDDVVASLSRAASEEFAGATASLLSPIDGWDEISGAAESTSERNLRIMRGLAHIDSASLTISLARRDADFLRVLAHPIASPLPRKLIESDPDRLAAQPVCAGPYKLSEPWKPGAPVVRLDRNPHYYGRNPAYSNGGKGYADSVEFHTAKSPFALWQQGTVDVAAVPADQRGAVAPNDLHARPSGHIEFIGLPTSGNSPFKDPAVRRALSKALDRTAISATREPARGFLPPAAGPSSTADGCKETAPSEPVVDTATDLSAVQLELSYNEEFGNAAMAQAVANQWHAAFGMTVTLKPTPFERITEKARDPQGPTSAFRLGWQPAAPRPEAYLGPLFTSAGIGRDNLARFVDPAFERAIERDARSAADEEERDLAYRALEQRLCESMPLIPLVAAVSRFAVRSSTVGTAGLGKSKPTLDRARGWPILRELFVQPRGDA